MLYTVEGNLLISDCDVIAHQANCEMVMKSGFAKDLAYKYPSVLEADRSFELGKGRPRLGKCSHSSEGGKYLVNLYGQLLYRRRHEPLDTKKTSHYMLSRAVDSMLELVTEWEEQEGRRLKVGLPFGIGCVRGGGDWHVVSDLLRELAYFHRHELFLYKWNPPRN